MASFASLRAASYLEFLGVGVLVWVGVVVVEQEGDEEEAEEVVVVGEEVERGIEAV